MKAAVCYQFGEPLVVEDVEIDRPARGEVLVRIAACAICHSDVHALRGEWGGNLPVIAGHEAAGVVEAVGDGVALAQPGDRVAVSLLRACGHCFYCTIGSPHLCAHEFALESEFRLHGKEGRAIYQGIGVGGFAEQAIVDQSQVVRVPDDVPLDCAALLACGVITGVGAVVNKAQVGPGSSVVVIGVGGVGLNAVQGASLSGASPVIALDTRQDKLDAARTFGATHVLGAGREDLTDAVRALTDGRGADYVFVTVGSPHAAAQALRLTRRGGTVVLVGIPASGASVPLDVGKTVISEQRVLGCVMGSTRLRVDVPRLVELYRGGRLKLGELISARYPLEQVNEAIASTERGEALRNVIVMS